MVGAPHPRLVLPRRTHDDTPPGSHEVRHVRLLPAHAGFRCAGYMVLVWIVALLHSRLAGTDSGSEVLLPNLDHGNRLRHPVLLVGSAPGNDTNLSVKKVEANRNFANKIWNAGRFVISAIDNLPAASGKDSEYSLADSWIWAKLQQLVRDVERLFQTYQYGEAGRQIYDFFWSEFADWYVEAAKQQMQDEGHRRQTVTTLARVLDISLRLLHPFTPFVTEELWGHLRTTLHESTLADLAADWPEALIVAPWPEAHPAEGWEEDKVADFTLVQEIVRSIRNLRAERGVSPARKLAAHMAAGARTVMLKEQSNLIAALAGLDTAEFTITEAAKKAEADSVALSVGSIEIQLPLAGMVDLEAERERLVKELAESEAQIVRLEQLLAGEFAQKAPAAVVAREQERLGALKETAEKLRAQLQ